MRPQAGFTRFVKVTDAGGRSLALPSGRTLPPGERILIETDRYKTAVATQGYVSGVAAGSFEDKATGARDLGFGLSVVDFLLEPTVPDAAVPPGQYEFNNLVHGRIAKRYVEGPQICTQAKQLPARVNSSEGFAVIRLSYRWTVAYPPHSNAGSIWEQTLIFPEGERFFLSADRVTTVSTSPELFLRVDMPGHIRHRAGAGFDRVYLSYQEPPMIPATEFLRDFPPDSKFLYRRGVDPLPRRFIRAYQVQVPGRTGPGPWLAGMTLNPGDVYQAWCHQRGYVCLIEELWGRATRPGDTLGACYLIGWFDDPDQMARTYDRFAGSSGLALDDPNERPSGYRTLKTSELTPVSQPS
jgi:hypothetical protein